MKGIALIDVSDNPAPTQLLWVRMSEEEDALHGYRVITVIQIQEKGQENREWRTKGN